VPEDDWIRPHWPAPPQVKAVLTTRFGGVSEAPYDTFNLATHVGDDRDAVVQNRLRLVERLALPSEPLWMTQVHGCAVADPAQDSSGCRADAAQTETPGRVCVVLTADCLPLLLCNRGGTRVATVHAGWRGLAAGVIEAAVACFSDPPETLVAWMGPAIGPSAFEVGRDVRDAFVRPDPGSASAFLPAGKRWLADIYRLARRRLARLGIGFIAGGNYCTVTDPRRFFSYRRDAVTGRMATLIWIDPRAKPGHHGRFRT